MFSQNYTIYEIMWKDKAETDRQTNRQVTDDSTMGLMRFACWISNATDSLLFHGKNNYANAPQYYLYGYIESILILFQH
jgi:hypothetical protein